MKAEDLDKIFKDGEDVPEFLEIEKGKRQIERENNSAFDRRV